MREILFRGKRLDTGEWVEGWLYKRVVHLEGCHQNVVVDAIEVYDGKSPLSIAYYTVDPATVGQYTGLTDRNGKRIFEGDVLVSFFCDDVPNYGERSVVLWHKHAWCSQYRDYKPETLEDYEMTNYVDVIGNIYDNPELLEKEAGAHE